MPMPDPGAGGISSGEIGGVLAGIIAGGMAIGKGLAWLLNWRDARANTRTAKLDKWHDELEQEKRDLDERRKDLDAKLDERMESLEQQVARHGVAIDRWRMAFHLVAAELLQRDPKSMALMQAQKILAEAFPLNLAVPEDMEATLGQIDAAGGMSR